jgi:hypothetical protein
MDHGRGSMPRTMRKHHTGRAFGALPEKTRNPERELRYPTQMIQRIGVTVARWRRPVLDAFLTVGPPLLLLGFLIAIDERVREQLTLRVAPDRAMLTLVSAGSTVRSLGAVLVEAGRDQSLAHAPLLIFAMAAGMLTLFMVRT